MLAAWLGFANAELITVMETLDDAIGPMVQGFAAGLGHACMLHCGQGHGAQQSIGAAASRGPALCNTAAADAQLRIPVPHCGTGGAAASSPSRSVGTIFSSGAPGPHHLRRTALHCPALQVEQDGQYFNSRWGYLCRSGVNDRSQLMRQIEKYADVFTSRVSNFLRYTVRGKEGPCEGGGQPGTHLHPGCHAVRLDTRPDPSLPPPPTPLQPYMYFRSPSQSLAHDRPSSDALVLSDESSLALGPVAFTSSRNNGAGPE